MSLLPLIILRILPLFVVAASLEESLFNCPGIAEIPADNAASTVRA